MVLALLLLPAVSAAAAETAPSPSVRPLVHTACNATGGNYDVCVATLLADPSSATADLRGLCAIAVSAAAANASASQAAIANATSPVARRVPGLFRACADKYAGARDALVGARDAVVGENYDVAYFTVSDAGENPSECWTLFRDKGLPYPVELASMEEALEQLCGIALDIILLVSA
jgi:pectinesterase inhibitor-like protein